MTNMPRTAPDELLATKLTEWHLAAGGPSVRTIATATGAGSPSTVHDTLAGNRIPSWPILSKIVEYLQGDLDEAHALWAQSRTSARSAPEPEVAALGAAVRALGPLDRPAQRRVLAYLEGRFGGEEAEP
jgi:hypothetical protein